MLLFYCSLYPVAIYNFPGMKKLSAGYSGGKFSLSKTLFYQPYRRFTGYWLPLEGKLAAKPADEVVIINGEKQ